MPAILLLVLSFIKTHWKAFLIGFLAVLAVGFVLHIKHELGSVHHLQKQVKQETQQVQLYSKTLDQQKAINTQINTSYNDLITTSQTTQATVTQAKPIIKQIVTGSAPNATKLKEVSSRINADFDLLGGAK